MSKQNSSPDNRLVGFINNDNLITCCKCGPKEGSSHLSYESIYPYQQSCHLCGDTMVMGDEMWSELFCKEDVVPATIPDKQKSFPLPAAH